MTQLTKSLLIILRVVNYEREQQWRVIVFFSYWSIAVSSVWNTHPHGLSGCQGSYEEKVWHPLVSGSSLGYILSSSY